MRAMRFYITLCLVALATVASSCQAAGNDHHNRSAQEIPIDGAIGPATADFVVARIHEANRDHAPLIVLRIDTPGGLSTSMRDIVKAILGSAAPVVGYVAPSGARAASAGTYILYATHIAAMAPATNLGAATPVELGGAPAVPTHPQAANDHGKHQQKGQSGSGSAPDLGNAATERRKEVNDAVAYIRALAERRHRNAEWAAKAVRQAASLTAQQALKRHVINLVADNSRDLLNQLDGRRVVTLAGPVVLHTKGLALKIDKPGWRTTLLAVVTDPSIAYLLFMIGIVGLAAEALNPGATVPGVVGGICLITALFAFHVLPVSYSGAALIVLGVALFVAEAFVPTFGALGVGGIAAIVFGSIMLMDTGVPGYNVSMGLIIGIAVAAMLILGLMLWLFARSRRAHVETGSEGLIGRECQAQSDFGHAGRVWLHGESWQAVSTTPVHRNQILVVTEVRGLIVYVRPRTATESANAGEPPEG